MPSINRHQQHARQNEAFALRAAGETYQTIAYRLGYASTGSVQAAVRAAAERQGVAIPNTRRNPRRSVRPTIAPSTFSVNTVADLPSTRTFGCEFEFFGISITTAAAALRAAGLDVVTPGYTHQVMRQWKIVTDASVDGSGLELVSPVLSGTAGIAQMKAALKALADAGAVVNKSCGFHLHIGCSDMNGSDLIRVVNLYAANHTGIDMMLARSRRNDACFYARHIPANSVVRHGAFTQVGQSGSSMGLRSAIDNIGTRYYSVNLKSFVKYGTIEFRQHQGTLNGDKAEAWVRFILSFVEAAHADRVNGSLGNRDEMIAAVCNGTDAAIVGQVASRFALA